MNGLDGRNSSMINGGEFDGAKAYKDSKVGGSSSSVSGLALPWHALAYVSWHGGGVICQPCLPLVAAHWREPG
jgi:hypothetical protein